MFAVGESVLQIAQQLRRSRRSSSLVELLDGRLLEHALRVPRTRGSAG